MKPDRNTLVKWIGNSLLVIGASIGGFAMVTTWKLSKDLPAGVCPYTSTRPWLYVAVVLVLAALVLSFFEKPGSRKK